MPLSPGLVPTADPYACCDGADSHRRGDVPKTFVFGTLRKTPENLKVYAWIGVPKEAPKSKCQNLANFMSFGTLVL